ncbi:MAG: ATPase [Defluviitaleaceae bacterium]|nr:ATPase [Defluviitaleaceae bacterium]
MEPLLDYLDQIEDILDGSKAVPFSNRISVEKERIFDVISEIRLNLPNEIRHAQRIISEHDKVINDAKIKAGNIIKEAESEAKMLTNNHEIFKRANEQAAEFIEETKKSARDMRLNAMDYTDEVLEKSEAMIRETMQNMEQQYKYMMEYFTQTIDVLYENRQQLRSRP